MRPEHRLQYSHYSPLSGLSHTVTIDLPGNGTGTDVTLAQDHNATEAARMHSEKNGKMMMLDGLKKYVESEPESNGATG